MWCSPQTLITRKDCTWQTQPLMQTLWDIKVWHRCTLLDHRRQRKLCMTSSGSFEFKSSRKCHVAALPHLNLPHIWMMTRSWCHTSQGLKSSPANFHMWSVSAERLQTVFPLWYVWCPLILPATNIFLHMEYLNVLHRQSATGAVQVHGDYATVYTIWGLNPGRGKRLFFPPKYPCSLLFSGYHGSFLG